MVRTSRGLLAVSIKKLTRPIVSGRNNQPSRRSKSNDLFLTFFLSISHAKPQPEISYHISLATFPRPTPIILLPIPRNSRNYLAEIESRSSKYLWLLADKENNEEKVLFRMPRRLGIIRNILGKKNKYVCYEARVFLRRILPRTPNDRRNSRIRRLENREDSKSEDRRFDGATLRRNRDRSSGYLIWPKLANSTG